MSYVQPDLIAWWYKGLYYRDLQMSQSVERGFLSQSQHDEIKDANGWWGGYRYVAQSPQRDRPEWVPEPPMVFSSAVEPPAEDDAEHVEENPVDVPTDPANVPAEVTEGE